jgi:hypothetical protein
MKAAQADIERATPERLLALSGELRAERAQARLRLRAAAEERMLRTEATRALERAEFGLEEAQSRRQLVAARLERTPAWRRRERAELRAALARAGEDVQRHGVERRAARGELDRIGPGDDARERARRLGAELERVEERLATWRALDDRGRSRVIEDRSREAPVRGLGRGL